MFFHFSVKKSLQLRSRLVNIVNKIVCFCNLKKAFRSAQKLKNMFHFKDNLNKKSAPFLFIDIRVVTTTLLITVKLDFFLFHHFATDLIKFNLLKKGNLLIKVTIQS